MGKLKNFETILNRISKEELYNYYIAENHSNEETKKHFGIYSDVLIALLKHYKIQKNTMMDVLMVKAPKEKLLHYYIEESHNIEECCNHFDITIEQLYKLLKKYGFKKHGSKILKALEEIDRNEFFQYYVTENHTRKETLKHFNITINTFRQLCNKYNISFHDKYEISKERLYQFYIIDNHTTQECAEHFHIGANLLNRLLKKHNIKKEQSLINLTTQNKCYERYGVPYHCMTKDCRTSNGKTESKTNKEFASLLKKHNIDFEQEFIIEHSSFDFKIGDKLVELNPAATHNTTWNPFGPKPTITKEYHIDKSKLAQKYGYQCICIWEWDDKEKIINNLLLPQNKIYARKCQVREVPLEEANPFITNHHLQGNIKSQVKIGLYYDNNLVSIMTFGRPRYNKKYEWELLRYCSSCSIIGGAEKIFQYFIKTYSPISIISYCDFSKFTGKVYKQLGFTQLRFNSPSLHWYNIKTHKHITNNLLNQRGFDQLLGGEYGKFGKGTPNRDLMLQHGFVEIYDCGQITFVWEKRK